ncbi:MAG TPA: hypothetical protein VFG62_04170 [Rhodopila sp.]|nr:hypothetical protein [Rhodopila sp.]
MSERILDLTLLSPVRAASSYRTARNADVDTSAAAEADHDRGNSQGKQSRRFRNGVRRICVCHGCGWRQV